MLSAPSKRNLNRQQFSEKPCQVCVFQRNSDLSSVFLRLLPFSSPPSEDVAFGHCFICVHCVGSGMPNCFGWWPEDPDGGDYEGDNGQLQSDQNEYWQSASCSAIEEDMANSILNSIQTYPQNNRYQVLNVGGRSCLGFCYDILNNAGLKPIIPYWNASTAGTLQLKEPSSTWTNTKYSHPAQLIPSLYYKNSFAH